ncbi:hypothetical protein AWRI1631_46110 [Saccharomyces cerevisiae AWRI1631]|uniref:Uncharacterized protein n=1 Tax=Saccharomyces cerevisiae (strain AWRI1631) TaxID=545124 RepID=B5VGS5_YEAS6|nr:hypothetical protein AWRI1631_46110 [Saccharomyces cerevisiae AWRI1631]
MLFSVTKSAFIRSQISLKDFIPVVVVSAVATSGLSISAVLILHSPLCSMCSSTIEFSVLPWSVTSDDFPGNNLSIFIFCSLAYSLRALLTLSSNDPTNLFRFQGSNSNCRTINKNIFIPIKMNVPQVDVLRILSDHICSSWYLVKIALYKSSFSCSSLLSISLTLFFSSCSCLAFKASFLYSCVNLSKSLEDHALCLCNNSLTSLWD